MALPFNPMWIPAAIGTVQSLFGGGNDDSASSSASNAPTQTADQAEMSATLKPYLKGFMQKPAKIEARPYQQTKVTVGGNKMSYTPGSTTVYGAPRQQITQQQSNNALNYAPNRNVIMTGEPGSYTETPIVQNDPNAPKAQVDYGFPSPGSYFDTTPGSVNMPDSPTFNATYGKQGGFVPYSDKTGMIMDATGNYVDRTGAIKDATGNYIDRTGAIQDANRNVNIGNIQEGYDASYLKDLAEKGINPLNEAYSLSMNKADSDINRKGLQGSGFQQNMKYGNQPDSITRNYMTQAGNVSRDVSLAGAEAARADRAANRNFEYNQELANRGLDSQEYQALIGQEGRNFGQQGEQLNRLTDAETRNKQQARDRISGLTSQEELNKAENMRWASFLQNQDVYDNANKQQAYQNDIGLGQWLTGREDSIAKDNRNLDTSFQQQNIAYQNDAMNNMQSFISGQNMQASNLNNNYWNAQKMADAQSQRNNQSVADAIALGTSWKNPAPYSSGYQFPTTDDEWDWANSEAYPA